MVWRWAWLVGLLSWLMVGCMEPRWISEGYEPSSACDPSKHIDASDPRWRESLGGLGFAWGCLSLRWSDAPADVQGVPVQLESDGKVFGFDQASGVFSASVRFTPSASRSAQRTFQLHVFPPGSLEQDDPDRMNKHRAICDEMKDKQYDCFAAEQAKRCWFVMRFSWQTNAAASSSCAIDLGGGACRTKPDFGKPCTKEQDGCQRAGTWSCAPDGKSLICDVGGDPKGDEVCDGEDNDCDGDIDEGIEPRACYDGPKDTQGIAGCKAGTQRCQEGRWGSCEGQSLPQSEVCDGKDNDCDGQVDEDLRQECYDGPSGTNNIGICKGGVKQCDAGAWSRCEGQLLPAKEDCNGKDDDCNGLIDDDCTSALIVISNSINASNGEIDGTLSQYWNKDSKVFEFPNLRIPPSAKVVAGISGFVRIKVDGPVEILGSLDISGLPGGDVNCGNSSFGDSGKSRGGLFGGIGGFFDPKATKQPSGTGGGGTTGGGGGKTQEGLSESPTVVAGGGGGGGHAFVGQAGEGNEGGAGGQKAKAPTVVSLGGAGGGGGCAIGLQKSSNIVTFIPGGGGGGSGGVLVIEATGTITVSGSILATGGDGGSSATCINTPAQTKVSGGGGGGGAGGHIRLQSDKEIIFTKAAIINADGGRGGGPTIAKGGNGGGGLIQLRDADGQIPFNDARISPTPVISSTGTP